MKDITRATGRLIAAVDSSVTALRMLVEATNNQEVAAVLAGVADLLDGAKYEAAQAAAREGDRLLSSEIFRQISALGSTEHCV